MYKFIWKLCAVDIGGGSLGHRGCRWSRIHRIKRKLARTMGQSVLRIRQILPPHRRRFGGVTCRLRRAGVANLDLHYISPRANSKVEFTHLFSGLCYRACLLLLQDFTRKCVCFVALNLK